MLVVMQSQSTSEQIDRVLETIRRMGLTPHPMPGATRTAIGITGNTGAVDPRLIEVLPGVHELIRVTKPYKLASREMHPHDTVVRLAAGQFWRRWRSRSSPGPCSVEDEAMILRTAEWLMARGIRFLRAGAFKPRTSPYAFQGMGLEGLEILARAVRRRASAIVTELMDTENADAVEAVADVIQIGTRNMQNFSLLRRVSRARQPVLLKRGMSATLEEWLMSAEYLLSGGNYNVILCERGVRHVLRSQPQHAGSVGHSACQGALASADRGRPQPRHGQARLRAADGAGGAGRRRRWVVDRGSSGSRSRAF